jgi:opacity protein-like surface antigen
MRLFAACAAGVLTLGGVAQAQTAPPPDTGYVQAVAETAFGSSTSQSYGAEAGLAVQPNVQVFLEVGRINNVATQAFGAAAQSIAAGLAQTQTNVGVTAKEPAVFGLAGIRYLVPIAGTKVLPYASVGFGLAKVSHDVTFTIDGADVTSRLDQFFVTLGGDLSGSLVRPMLALGGGVLVPVWRQVGVDLHYRYGRIFTPGEGINVNRAGIGLGVRF